MLARLEAARGLAPRGRLRGRWCRAASGGKARDAMRKAPTSTTAARRRCGRRARPPPERDAAAVFRRRLRAFFAAAREQSTQRTPARRRCSRRRRWAPRLAQVGGRASYRCWQAVVEARSRRACRAPMSKD